MYQRITSGVRVYLQHYISRVHEDPTIKDLLRSLQNICAGLFSENNLFHIALKYFRKMRLNHSYLIWSIISP